MQQLRDKSKKLDYSIPNEQSYVKIKDQKGTQQLHTGGKHIFDRNIISGQGMNSVILTVKHYATVAWTSYIIECAAGNHD